MQRRQLSLLFVIAISLSLFTSFTIPINPTERTEIIHNDSEIPQDDNLLFLSSSFPAPMNITGTTYSTHSRITITSNTEFLSTRDSEVWDGNGTELDPIIITGYNFTETTGDLISISNTDLYFEIHANYFKVPTQNHDGINLSNVTNDH